MIHKNAQETLPKDFLQRLLLQYPKEAPWLFDTFHQRPPVIRVNTLLTTLKELGTQFSEHGIQVEKLPLLPNALVIKNSDRKQLTGLQIYGQGFFYIQSIASQLAVKALDPQPGEKIFDMCAAPGSKTSQIALEMKCQGELLANEPNANRFYKLRANLQHQKLETFVTVKKYPGQNYPAFYPEHFDRVLVDAPCSSESRFIIEDEKTFRYWSKPKVKSMAKMQKKLLSAAIHCTKPGGTIVYSTCSLSPEENELVIQDVLKRNPEIQMVKLGWQIPALPILSEWNGKAIDQEVLKAFRLFPNETQESFFIAKLKKAKTLPGKTQANQVGKRNK